LKIIFLYVLLVAPLLGQQFSLFEGDGDAGVDLSFELEQSGGNLDFIISNNSIINAVVTKVAFEDNSDILTSISLPPHWSVNNSLNISGSNNIGFSTTLGIVADPPPVISGIHSGEDLTLSLAHVYLGDFVPAINDGSIRVAMHVQSIGYDAISSSYVNTKVKPEISTSMLGAVGLAATIFRRNRKI